MSMWANSVVVIFSVYISIFLGAVIYISNAGSHFCALVRNWGMILFHAFQRSSAAVRPVGPAPFSKGHTMYAIFHNAHGAYHRYGDSDDEVW